MLAIIIAMSMRYLTGHMHISAGYGARAAYCCIIVDLFELCIVLSIIIRFRFFFFQGTNKLYKQEKNVTKKPHLAAVFDCRTIIVGYYNNIIIIQLPCAYNIDDLFHTGRIDLPGMEKVVYIVCAYYMYTQEVMSRPKGGEGAYNLRISVW